MLRLGHIACCGLAFVNLAFVVTAQRLGDANLAVPSVILLIGAATMPAVCFVSAWKPAARCLFPIPVLSLLLGCGWTAWLVLEAP